MNATEARTQWLADAPRFAELGINLHGVEGYMTDEFKRDFVVYFPQPGDDPATIKQKAVARAAAMQGIAGEGGAYFKKQNPTAASQLERYTTPQETGPAPGAGGNPPIRVNSPDEAARLPPGTEFITPEGERRTKR